MAKILGYTMIIVMIMMMVEKQRKLIIVLYCYMCCWCLMGVERIADLEIILWLSFIIHSTLKLYKYVERRFIIFTSMTTIVCEHWKMGFSAQCAEFRTEMKRGNWMRTRLCCRNVINNKFNIENGLIGKMCWALVKLSKTFIMLMESYFFQLKYIDI